MNFHNAVTIVGGTHDVLALEADDIINNYGTFTSPGTIDLGDGANFFNNRAGATFNSGEIVDLGEQSITQDVEVFVDGDGYAVQTDDGSEDTPEGLFKSMVTGNTFFNAGDISPGGIDSLKIITWEDDPTTLDEMDEIVRTVQEGIQTTQLIGNFIQIETGTFTVNIDTASGASDKLEILSGTATLDGRVFVLPSAYLENDLNRYVILSTDGGSITGEMLVPLFSNYDADYSTDNEVALVFSKAPTYCDVARSHNQNAVACKGLPTLPVDHDVIANLHRIVGEDDVRAAYDALTGEIHPSVSGLLMEDSSLRSDAALQRLHALVDREEHVSYGLLADAQAAAEGALAALAPNDWWFEARGGVYERDANTSIGTAELDHEATGFLIGADHSNEGWVIGDVGGQSTGETDIEDRLSDADTETWSFGMYGSVRIDAAQGLPLHLSFGACGNWHNVNTNRTVEFDDFHEDLEADYAATSFQAFAEIGTHVDVTDDLFVHPFASVSHTSLETDGFTEAAIGDSTNEAALTADDANQSLTTTTLGLRSGIEVGLGEDRGNLKLHSMVGWRHNFGDIEPETEFAFAQSGGDKFTNNGSPIAEDALITEFSIGSELSPGITFAAIYRGQLAEDSQAHSLQAHLSGRF